MVAARSSLLAAPAHDDRRVRSADTPPHLGWSLSQGAIVQAFAVEPSVSQQRWARSKVSRGEYARQRRVQLCAVLSPDGCCAQCSDQVGHEALTIDHVDGCTWNKT